MSGSNTKKLTSEQCLDILQKNVQLTLHHYLPLFAYYDMACCNPFIFIQSLDDDIIKSQAMRLYIDTMVSIYSKSEIIKSKIFICFGCSFYKSEKHFFLGYEQSQKEYCDTQIKKGIIISLIGNTSLFLLSLCLNQII